MPANRRKYENPPPPSEHFDFCTCRIIKEKRYFTEYGDECKYLHLIAEEHLKTPPESEDESCYFLSESEDEEDIVPILCPPKKTIKAEPASPPPIEKVYIKKEPTVSKEDESRKKEPRVVKEDEYRKKDSKSSKDVEYRKKDTKSSKEDEHRRKEPKSSKEEDYRKKEVKSSKEDNHCKKEKSSSSSKSKRPVVDYSESDDENSFRESKNKPKIESESKYKPKLEYKPIKREDSPETKPLEQVSSAAFDEYICKVCNITVNSEVTFQTHLVGKKHLKALKAQHIPEVAMQSLTSMAYDPRAASQIRRIEPPVKGDRIHYPLPPPGIKRVRINDESKIQHVVETFNASPLPGLSQLIEIRHYDKTEPTYYCILCDAPCAPSSILSHLTGFKHQLNSLDRIDPTLYEKYRIYPKRSIERSVIRHLEDYEKRHGRSTIQVEEEVVDKAPSEPQPGPSWRDDRASYSRLPTTEDTLASAMVDLDTSQNDFRCIVCDAHMNNQNMWEAHIRGKKHLKNKKKYPGEVKSKVSSIPCPNAQAHLDRQLEDVHDPIVGLEFIRETQGEMGDMYNCFLCGACTSEFDIVEHLLTTKHRVKFLEAMNKKRGDCNGIEHIKALHDVSNYYKDRLIEDECITMMEKFGIGKVEVYQSKKCFGLTG